MTKSSEQLEVHCPQESIPSVQAALVRAGLQAYINPPLDAKHEQESTVLYVRRDDLDVERGRYLKERNARCAVAWLEEKFGYTEYELLSQTELADSLRKSPIHCVTSKICKRGIDLLCSLSVLLILAVISPFLALWIKRDSPGPIFFRQQRVGRNNRRFDLIKFRTMEYGADKGSLYTDEEDTRVTLSGKYLRRLHLDEIPQIVNVFRNQMSLVGPRPEIPKNIEGHLRQMISTYDFRHVVKPGILGWSQLCYGYPREREHFLQRQRYDLYYLRHYSIWLDIRICLQTVWSLTFGSRPQVKVLPQTPDMPSGLAEAASKSDGKAVMIILSTQQLVLFDANKPVECYGVSTAAVGANNKDESYGTPLGMHKIGARIGGGAEIGTVFKGRKPNGVQITPQDSKKEQNGEDVITTRILWLEGLEEGVNRGEGCDTKSRYIYIHGTPHESKIGQAVSKGCIRMRNDDVCTLFERVPEGTPVLITS